MKYKKEKKKRERERRRKNANRVRFVFPVNICHAWTTVEEVVVVGEHQGKSSVLRFYLHKMMGLAMSRSKCRPLGSRPARFSSQISLRRPSPRRYDVAKLLLRSLSKCKLKKRRAFFHHAFTSKRAPFDPSSLCSKVAQIPSSSSLDSSWPREIFFFRSFRSDFL